MKVHYITLLGVFLTLNTFAQELRVGKGVAHVPGNEIVFFIADYSNSSGLLLDFGDGQEAFLKKRKLSCYKIQPN